MARLLHVLLKLFPQDKQQYQSVIPPVLAAFTAHKALLILLIEQIALETGFAYMVRPAPQSPCSREISAAGVVPGTGLCVFTLRT